ncbi:MAG: beta-ketoacyl-ACP synthase II [Oligoflexales bacterium]|nr:beta-ketoacyl-ACP synthase II [Oligoflexales bacterium]
MRRVVVTGLGLISPVGLSFKESWAKAIAGVSGVGLIQSFDSSHYSVQIAAEVKGFDPHTVMEPKEARKASRFIQLTLAAAKEALENSGIDLSKENNDRFGCSVGVGIGSIQSIYETSLLLAEGGPKKVSPFFIPYVITNMAAGIVSNHFNLRGANLCTATACTSGTHAIGEAYMYIKHGMADTMLCGGSESAICEIAIVGFGNMKALSKNNEHPQLASRPFDKNRDGFVMGEGSGLLVLEEYEKAKARGAHIYAELCGYGVSADAHHITAPAPEGEGAQRCMREALKSAGIQGTDVDYINAHGTSTHHNDINESLAILKVFGEHAYKVAISSTKGVTGHCLGAAGGMEAVFLAAAIDQGLIPPTANLHDPDPDCPLDYVPLKARQAKIRHGISNSFGFGGTNGSLVMRHKDLI